jgi:hypothetical protein
MVSWRSDEGINLDMTIPPDMQAELDKFDQGAEAAVAAFVRELEAEPPPPMIFHYTDDAGLKGILESGTFRLTSFSNLNDPSELKHGFSHAVDILNARAAKVRMKAKCSPNSSKAS